MTSSSSSTKDSKQAGLRVRAYLASQSPGPRRDLRKIRDAIRTVAPGATESFSYRIPGFRIDGKSLIWYAGWKHHISLYPITAVVKRVLARELQEYEISKGTIRFPLGEPPPLALVKRIVKARVAELRAG